ncbi:MAG: hypothetical protein P1V97_39385, partial [Planctomycetota bacterium]|nr:hypothetical protein [Planctomycetota bacterium]
EARQLLARGANSDKILAKVMAALAAGDRSATQLLAAAKICDEANLDKRQELLLEEVIERHPPAYEALFNLHQLTLKRKNSVFHFTMALRKLYDLSQKRGDENEFTLFCAAVALSDTGKNKE